MNINGYSYKRYPDSKGGQVHVVETRHGRFEAGSKEDADRLAWTAEVAYEQAKIRAEDRRQIALEEQRKALAFTDNRRGA